MTFWAQGKPLGPGSYITSIKGAYITALDFEICTGLVGLRNITPCLGTMLNTDLPRGTVELIILKKHKMP